MATGFAFRECFAEFMGVLTLVFFGGWATVLVINDKSDLQGVAMVHAFAIGIFAWAGQAYSKCHFNPAISLGFFAVKKINGMKLVFYVTSQFIGSYVGALLVYYTLPESLYTTAYDKRAELGCPHLNNTFKAFTALTLELIGSFTATLVFVSLADQGKMPFYGPAVGFATALCYYASNELSGPSVNPFRYLGPALLTFDLIDSYMYLIVPLLGALAAVAMYEYVFALTDSEKAAIERKHHAKTVKIE